MGKYGFSNKFVEKMGVSNAIAKNIMIQTLDEGIKGGVSGFASGATEKAFWGTGDIWESTWKGAAYGAANGLLNATGQEIMNYYKLKNLCRPPEDDYIRPYTDSDLPPIPPPNPEPYMGYLGTTDGEISCIYNLRSRTVRGAMTRNIQTPTGTRVKISYYDVPTSSNFDSIVKLLRLK